jgi:hypothetical protein
LVDASNLSAPMREIFNSFDHGEESYVGSGRLAGRKAH